MKLSTPSLATFSLLAMMACHSNKKTTVAAAAPAPSPAPVPAANTTTVSAAPSLYMVERPAAMIPEPGEAQLTAIQATYKNVTMEDLTLGHKIYTKGACIGCHVPQPVTKYSEGTWKGLVMDMAQKAMISDSDRDAVYKYVMAVKAAETKGPK